MTPPLVSVVVPCHGREEQLRDCLASVATQTWARVEVIVVDDASPRPLAPIVMQIPWPDGFEVETVRNADNLGPGGAREVGRRRVTGDYVCYLDSDDLWSPRKLEVQVMALEAAVEASMCYSPTLLFRQLPMEGDEQTRPRSDESFDRFLPTILDGRPWSTSSCMWRRDATDRIGPWYRAWTWEDYEYDCRAGCLDFKVLFVDEPLTYYHAAESTDRLSMVARHERIEGKAASLLEMSRNLRAAGKLTADGVRSSLEWLVYSTALQCLDVGDLRTHRLLLRDLRRVTSSPLTRLVTRTQPWVSFLLPRTSRRLGTRLRPVLFSAGT